jgi:sodium-dependent dicarboxylate transporter 2/3/5
MSSPPRRSDEARDWEQFVVVLGHPLLSGLREDDPFGPGLLIGIAVAANLGGMGSLIGTPPNILIPLAITMAPGGEAAIVIPVALAASSAMCLPIATPPNALAYATGRCTTADFLRLGAILGVLAPLGAVVWLYLISEAVRRIG